VKVREVKFKDFIYISKLQSRHNLKSILKYKNKFVANYSYFSKKNPIGWVLEDKGEIRGFIGNLIKKYTLKNKYYLSSSINSLVVDKNYRENTYLLLRRYFNQKNISFYFNSTPNDSTFKIWKKLGANEIPQITIERKLLYILKVENLINSYLKKRKFNLPYFAINLIGKIINFINFKKKNTKKDPNFNFVEIKQFNNKIKTFLNKSQKKNKLSLLRDKHWFDMNYSKTNIKESFLYLILKKKKIIGLIGLIENNNNDINLKRLELADFIIHKDDKNLYDNIINNIFLNPKFKKYDVIEAQGFSKEKFEILKNFFHFNFKLKSFPFLYKSKNKKIDLMLKNTNIWDFSLIDGDNLI
tara:strand:- start:5664 stop:6731 length:1068 start_codon:yes stop_codon:yes gene_type:complete